jgi:hypothetical protein
MDALTACQSYLLDMVIIIFVVRFPTLLTLQPKTKESKLCGLPSNVQRKHKNHGATAGSV